MIDGPWSVVGVVFILCFAALLAPVLGFTTWLEKRDCELVNQTECEWKIVPKENKNEISK